MKGVSKADTNAQVHPLNKSGLKALRKTIGYL